MRGFTIGVLLYQGFVPDRRTLSISSKVLERSVRHRRKASEAIGGSPVNCEPASRTVSRYYGTPSKAVNHKASFDTHASQLNTHRRLLTEVSASLKAFLDDLHSASHDSRVVVLVFSELGRRLRENASGGTDHGTAGPVFLLGPAVNPGVHGPAPNLRDLTDGDPRHAVDFRQIYATVLDQWLQCPSQQLLGEPFTHLQLLHV